MGLKISIRMPEQKKKNKMTKHRLTIPKLQFIYSRTEPLSKWMADGGNQVIHSLEWHNREQEETDKGNIWQKNRIGDIN